MVDPPLVGVQQHINTAPTHQHHPMKANSSSGPLHIPTQGEGYVSSIPDSSEQIGRRAGQGSRAGRAAGLPGVSQLPGLGRSSQPHEAPQPLGQHFYPTQVRPVLGPGRGPLLPTPCMPAGKHAAFSISRMPAQGAGCAAQPCQAREPYCALP
jgi:hypothetical protein